MWGHLEKVFSNYKLLLKPFHSSLCWNRGNKSYRNNDLSSRSWRWFFGNLVGGKEEQPVNCEGVETARIYTFVSYLLIYCFHSVIWQIFIEHLLSGHSFRSWKYQGTIDAVPTLIDLIRALIWKDIFFLILADSVYIVFSMYSLF